MKDVATPLSAASLDSLPPGVGRPSYDRSSVQVGVVHFGVGGFHRAHQAMYLDRLMNAGKALDWGICGVGIMPADRRMAEVMTAQDCLYTLVLRHPDGSLEARVIGSIVDYQYAPDDPESVIERMADSGVKIVSLTITEGGYNIDAATGDFDASNPAIQQDLEPGATPATLFGLITEALVRRREQDLPPFTILSCDNIHGNGDVARRSFVAFARLRDPELGAWMHQNVRFPNCMVDRITPVTTDENRAEVARELGIVDAWPVICEPFAQWVLADDFGTRPPLEDVGVQLVADVEPYELMKLRLLNVSHQALCYFGYLAGYRLVHEVAQDPLFAEFLLAYMDDDATPTLAPVPGIDLDAYKRNLIERFSNAQVRDTVSRLCAETSDRIPKWLVPVIEDNLAHGGSVAMSAAVVASWARYAEGVDEENTPIDVVDRQKAVVMAAAAQQRADPLAFLRNRRLFGDLVDDQRFTDAYVAVLHDLHRIGARKTLEELVAARSAHRPERVPER